jgi:predicted DsbA family dithiol-disulfide isomerase
MQALLWRDYLCPWCYLGRDRTRLLESLGVTVDVRSYELHPEIPVDGRTVRPDGRFAAVLEHIAAECEVAGLPFRRPSRIPNTRRVLEIAEVVRTTAPQAFPAVDAAFYDAQWVHDEDLGDPAVVDRILGEAGVDVDLDAGATLLDESMAEAREHDVTGTPAWWVDDRLLIPGVQDPTTLQRWIERLASTREDREPHR